MTEAASGPVVFIMGPTGAGKTDLAVRLARRYPVEIISVDSAMVYRGMDIGTAKPSAMLRATIRHHLIDVCDPAERYSAARFRTDALDAIAVIQARGRVPLLVGGTGLYFRALEQGISRLPESDPRVRARLDDARRQHGNAYLHQRLRVVDPASAARIHPNDPQRTMRALEIWELTGRPMSYLIPHTALPPLSCPVTKIVLAPADRGVLRARIAARFEAMLACGLVEEVRALRACADLGRDLPSMRAVGYQEVTQYLDGMLDYAAMTSRAVISTAQLAKRQYTWLRAEQHAFWFDSENSSLIEEIESFAAKHQIFGKIDYT